MLQFAIRFASLCLICCGTSSVLAQRGDWGGPGGRGGDMGGGPGGGGGWGGGGGGGWGGFDPSSFVDRLDANQNGMLDPEEMQGPAQFMVSRMQRDDPSIRTDRPIPISKIKESFDRMRSGRSTDRGREEDNRREADEKVAEGMKAALLVPGFGPPEDALAPEPVLGFGPTAELMAVAVTDQDRKESEELLRRYDRNNDQAISGDEFSSRWVGNPLDFDRNGDKKLTLNELAVRAAKLRIVRDSPEVQAVRSGKTDDRNRPRGGLSDPGNDSGSSHSGPSRKSYLTNAPKLPEGLPAWFGSKDWDGDLQVQMSEYASDWSDELVEEFGNFDTDGDGVITPQECLLAVRKGISVSGATSSSVSTRPSSSASGSTNSTLSAAVSGPAVSEQAVKNVDVHSKNYEYAKRMLTRYDLSKDGALTVDEWDKMIIKPTPADANSDGRITIPEYAAWLESRSSK